jgi:hydroxyacylglutathione hydrolase
VGAERVTLLRDGDSIQVGSVTIRALHTPGHTPEHISFLVADAMLTGDFLFVGDVGRPDLLERSVGVAGSADAGARALFHSLERLAGFPDALVIWPGHTAGSLCGKALGAEPSTTLGIERARNWAFRAWAEGEDAFVAQALADQPLAPAYFGRMKAINRDDPPVEPWAAPARAQRTPAELADPDHYVVDVRDPWEWAAGHVAGAHHLPLVALMDRVAEIPRDREVVVYCQSGARSTIAGCVLSGAKFPRVVNLAGGFSAWERAGLPVVRGA